MNIQELKKLCVDAIEESKDVVPCKVLRENIFGEFEEVTENRARSKKANLKFREVFWYPEKCLEIINKLELLEIEVELLRSDRDRLLGLEGYNDL